MKYLKCKVCVFVVIALSGCSTSSKLSVVSGDANYPVVNAMVYVWSYRLTSPPISCIRITNERGEVDFSNTPVQGRVYTYVVAKEGYYPMGGASNHNPAVLFKIPEGGRVSNKDIVIIKNKYDSFPRQDFVDVPVKEFRTHEGSLNVDELVMGLEDNTPDKLKERWIEAFKSFVAIRE